MQHTIPFQLLHLLVERRGYIGIVHTVGTNKYPVVGKHSLKDTVQRVTEYDAASQSPYSPIVHPPLPTRQVIVHQVPVITAMNMDETFFPSPLYQFQENQVSQVAAPNLRWSKINHIALRLP